jgi:hypothetical protein
MLTDRRQQPNHNTTIYYVYWQTTTTTYVVMLWFGCCCRPSVNTICGHVMIGLLLSSVSKHNIWLCYDWVVVVVRQSTQLYYDHILCLLTDDNDNPIITWPHIVFTDGRQQQHNHNMTTYCVYLRTTTSNHNMWSCYDWVVVAVRQ